MRCKSRTLVALLCSTPSGIRGYRTLPPPRDRRPAQGVLNAFRHQRLSHFYMGTAGTEEELCSTPSGIRGYRTTPLHRPHDRVDRVLNAFRHQRLSHNLCPTCHRSVHLCSTPSGIRGYRTHYAAPHSHPTTGAQRLPASEVIAPPCAPTGGGCARSAQRLPASEVIAPGVPPAPRGSPRVLNAFRHQRLSHGTDQARLHPRRDVLNAFRHQRLSHDRDQLDRRGRQEVLNAFRHQRLSHPIAPLMLHSSRQDAPIQGVIDAQRHRTRRVVALIPCFHGCLRLNPRRWSAVLAAIAPSGPVSAARRRRYSPTLGGVRTSATRRCLIGPPSHHHVAGWVRRPCPSPVATTHALGARLAEGHDEPGILPRHGPHQFPAQPLLLPRRQPAPEYAVLQALAIAFEELGDPTQPSVVAHVVADQVPGAGAHGPSPHCPTASAAQAPR